MPVERYQKIAFVAGTLATGGAERQLYYLAGSLVKQGYHVTVYCLTQHEFFESKLAENGVEVIYFGADKSKIKRVYHLYRLLKDYRPQLIYSFHFYANSYSAIAGKLLGIKVIGSIRSNAISEKKLNGWISWLHYMLPNSIIANSRHGADNCKKIFYKKNLFVLGNVIEVDLFRFEAKVPDNENPIHIIWVGRFGNEKQPWLFFELIKKLTDKGFDVRGSIYGDGVLKDELESLLNNQYRNYKISLQPMHPFIQDVYRNAHWLCSLSKYEGSPNVVLEAMACGVAIATLNYQGIQALITNGKNGLIQDEIEQLCMEIIRFSEKGLYKSLTIQARKKIEQHYSIHDLVPNFEAILQHI